MNDNQPIPIDPARAAISGERGPVRVWELLLPFVAVAAVFLIVVGSMFIYALGRGAADQEEARLLFVSLSSNFIVAQVFMGLIYVAMLAGIWSVARRRGPVTVLGYFPRVPNRLILLSILAGIGMAALVLAAIWWIGAHTEVTFRATRSEEALLVAHNPPELALSLAVIAVIAPFTEELYFRGLLLSWLRRWFWLPIAAIADATIFGLVHGRFLNHPGPEGWILTVMVGCVGLLNVFWFVRARSLWPAFLTHAFYNGVLVTLAYFGR